MSVPANLFALKLIESKLTFYKKTDSLFKNVAINININFISYFHTTKIIPPRNVETFCNVEPKAWKQISVSGLVFWFWI